MSDKIYIVGSVTKEVTPSIIFASQGMYYKKTHVLEFVFSYSHVKNPDYTISMSRTLNNGKKFDYAYFEKEGDAIKAMLTIIENLVSDEKTSHLPEGYKAFYQMMFKKAKKEFPEILI